jgi:hypothetical protein
MASTPINDLDKKANAIAVMTVTVEVRSRGGAWGDDCTIGQAYRQGGRECLNFLEDLLREHGDGRVRVLGEPQVTTVSFPQKT